MISLVICGITLFDKLEFEKWVNVMQVSKNQYVFPALERKIFTKAGLIMLPLELIVHLMFIIPSITHRNLDGVWVSLFFAIIFGAVHFQNLRLRKYCLAKWSFDGTIFAVYNKDTSYTIDVNQPFCISTTELSFARRYSPAKYPFIMIWKPGSRVPYEEMGGYQALKKRDALIIPFDDETIALFQEYLNVKEIPRWPKSSVYYGVSK